MSAKSVLIVDDSASMRALLGSVVEELGDYKILKAANGIEALHLLSKASVDLILTDIDMPEVNGLELISYIRNNPDYRDIPVFIISTAGSASDIEKGKQLGVDEYIVKPFIPEALQQLISQYLNRSFDR